MPTSQAAFHRNWGHLQDRHVRTLAWLLCAAPLLDSGASVWHGAGLSPRLPPTEVMVGMLTALDAAPAALHAALAQRPTRRLGLYAEQLLAFFLTQTGEMVAHGLQVHDAAARTLGEFDFVLRQNGALVHWELATKFYLFCPSAQLAPDLYDYVGPNLADTLGSKMHKILHQQLLLGQQATARAMLPAEISEAHALVRGWLFYAPALAPDTLAGIAVDHCRGEILTLTQLRALAAPGGLSGILLERLDWLAPAQLAEADVPTWAALLQEVEQHFSHSQATLLLALVQCAAGQARELSRAMIVADDWWQQAAQARTALRPV
ncbi:MULTISPECIES: DUF1853 family protein [unclassified Undibacterium]|uniref:DUF1853 family protein n=1 Tax=unclassified Undibacterium TaxID=2630295 RepID=UPI002AC9F0B8|nr:MULTISPECIES: DUF1853 family protein [unclassified Undibacterium]MEB0138059.1 DUF1853 family protein [Undibacterium sp. CCC2.1]MEB0171203.1 DUF1853 family protein [Undibacterium sp. CCC1.1]MEB0175248.1 DUF1853 family protein [Undibacterium sp. CCC3.4]MEB0214656.1 DUF1853 family protein [Undibacterium sp. 5I2]WPX42423.1 DUF1853 family protein [Undibacterium sp. CCC3.4]